MARHNPDPYTFGHLFALVNRVTGLLDTEEEANTTARVLEDEGVVPEDIDVFSGEQGARRLDLSGREHGRAFRLLRTLEAAVGHEGETNHRIEAALQKGATLLCVKVQPRKAEDKARAVRILKASHAHEIHYWGTWGCEDVPSTGTECALCTLPSERILGDNEHALWLLDLHPVSPGHSLIVAKRHVESFFETTPAERESVLSLLDRARAHVIRNYAPSGYNIGINEGAAAGSTVPHVHVHLIPRFDGDRENPRGGVRWVLPAKADYWTAH